MFPSHSIYQAHYLFVWGDCAARAQLSRPQRFFLVHPRWLYRHLIASRGTIMWLGGMLLTFFCLVRLKRSFDIYCLLRHRNALSNQFARPAKITTNGLVSRLRCTSDFPRRLQVLRIASRAPLEEGNYHNLFINYSHSWMRTFPARPTATLASPVRFPFFCFPDAPTVTCRLAARHWLAVGVEDGKIMNKQIAPPVSQWFAHFPVAFLCFDVIFFVCCCCCCFFYQSFGEEFGTRRWLDEPKKNPSGFGLSYGRVWGKSHAEGRLFHS